MKIPKNFFNFFRRRRPVTFYFITIDAEVPKAEMADYAIALRAMTQGKGSFTYRVVRYDEVPGMIATKVIAEAKARAAEED